ncbi:MAG TPA: hypothetical protein VL261_16720 [Nitrospira sp.]|jgi:hypothetical protein|nr:hypothetical protein [Nitrospira sp.]
MYRVLIVMTLIVLAQSALAAPAPHSSTEEGSQASWRQKPRAQLSRVPDGLESNLVGRLYTLTYGGRELCKQVGIEESARFERVLAGFHDAFPDVMYRLEQSSFFEETKRRFSRWIVESREVESADELANLCLADYTLLKAYTDNHNDPEVVENVSRIKKILTH